MIRCKRLALAHEPGDWCTCAAFCAVQEPEQYDALERAKLTTSPSLKLICQRATCVALSRGCDCPVVDIEQGEPEPSTHASQP